MEKMRTRIVRYAAEETSEGQKDIYLPELVEEEAPDDGVAAYAADDGEDFHGTDQELYAIMEQRV